MVPRPHIPLQNTRHFPCWCVITRICDPGGSGAVGQASANDCQCWESWQHGLSVRSEVCNLGKNVWHEMLTSYQSRLTTKQNVWNKVLIQIQLSKKCTSVPRDRKRKSFYKPNFPIKKMPHINFSDSKCGGSAAHSILMSITEGEGVTAINFSIFN